MNWFLFAAGISVLMLSGALGIWLDIGKNLRYPGIYWFIGMLGGSLGIALMLAA